MNLRNGLASLLRREDSVLVLIDHQPYQLANLNSHDPHIAVNNATALAKAAKVFKVPTILTSVVADRGGRIFPQIDVVHQHAAGSGIAYLREQQLLNTPVPTSAGRSKQVVRG